MSAPRRFALFLLPQFLQAGLSIVMVPVTTAVLNAEDFAAYALITGFTMLLGSFSGLGSTYMLAKNLQATDKGGSALVATLLWLSLAVGVAAAAALLGGWMLAAHFFAEAATVPMAAVALAAFGMVASVPWALAAEVTTLRRQAGVFAAATIAQTTIGAMVTIFVLYGLDGGMLALFAGTAAGQAATAVASFWPLRHDMMTRPERRWIGETFRLGLPLTGVGLLDGAATTLERTLLASNAGLQRLGVYYHSQIYLGFASMGSKSFMRVTWPTSLAEARAPDSTFAQTGRAWSIWYRLVTLAGIGFATLGDEVVGLLTNQKFNAAAPLAAIWMAVILLRLSGRPQQAVLFGMGGGKVVNRARLAAAVAALVAQLALIPIFGITGAVAAATLQAVVLRVMFTLGASAIRPVPFQDHWMLAGLAAIGGAIALVAMIEPSLPVRATVFVAAAILLTVSLAHSVGAVRGTTP